MQIWVEHSENTFASPRWRESLKPEERDALERSTGKAASQENREPRCLKEDGLRVARWKIVAREWL